MKHLKIVAKGFEGYNGLLGQDRFVDGVSVEPLPRNVRDRLSATMQMIEIDAEGEEQAAGVAHRLVSDSEMRAPVLEESPRMTESEKIEEMRQRILRGEKIPVSRFYTLGELEAVADKSGIKGLRVIADPWGLKSKRIVDLIRAILTAQDNYNEQRKIALAQVGLDESGKESPVEKEEPVKNEDSGEEGDQTEFDCLIGTNELEATYEINGETVQLGTIVAEAHKLFGGTVSEWNNLPDDTRDALIRDQLTRMLPSE